MSKLSATQSICLYSYKVMSIRHQNMTKEDHHQSDGLVFLIVAFTMKKLLPALSSQVLRALHRNTSQPTP